MLIWKTCFTLPRKGSTSLRVRSRVQSSLVEATEQAINVRPKALVDLEMVPTILPDDAKELERHKQVMIALQASLNPDTWMDTD